MLNKIFSAKIETTVGFIILIVLLTMLGIAHYYDTNNAEAGIPLSTDYRFKFIITSGGEYQTGLAADTKFSLMRNSDNYWFDFDDSTFKASGWTTISVATSEDTTNSDFSYYYYDWTVPSSETSPEIYTPFFKCTGATKAYDAFDISYDRITFYFGQ